MLRGNYSSITDANALLFFCRHSYFSISLDRDLWDCDVCKNDLKIVTEAMKSNETAITIVEALEGT